MSEVNLAALAESGQDRIEAKAPTPMQEVNEALKTCGLGIFHVRLLLTSLVGFVSGVLVSNTTSYLLPTAECDLNMDLVQKGLLNAMPYIGMLVSSVIAGFLTDTFGRKGFIYVGYGGICFFTLIAASSQTYEVLVSAKFFEGVLFATSFSAGVTITSEFCHSGIRDRVLICQSSFASISQIIIAAMSWGILMNDWRVTLFDGWFVLNTWNFYLYAMSLWSLSACTLYLFIPESPKFLITQEKYAEARKILTKIYRENNRNAKDNDPFKDLWKKAEQTIKEDPENVEQSLGHQIVVGLHNIKPMFRMPLVKYLTLVCSSNIVIMSLYNVLRLWFPQVSTIVEHNSFITDEGVNQDLCGMLDTYTSDLKMRFSTNTSGVCVPTKSGSETYINSIIIGLICILPYFISGVLVNRIGKKPLTIACNLIAVGATIGVRFANSKVAVVSLFALDIAINQMVISLNQAMIIEFFPTTTRTLAISMVMMLGRVGTLIGNIMFPIMLKMGCAIPFYTMASLMLGVVVMSTMLPTKKK